MCLILTILSRTGICLEIIAPLVVIFIASNKSLNESISKNPTKSFRTKGSPPVNLILVTPNSVNTLMMRYISLKVNNSSRGAISIP